jgi:hypothetical protein
MYGSHHQQTQEEGRNDEPDPFLVVREPSMHVIHGQPPSGYHHIYNRGASTTFGWPKLASKRLMISALTLHI